MTLLACPLAQPPSPPPNSLSAPVHPSHPSCVGCGDCCCAAGPCQSVAPHAPPHVPPHAQPPCPIPCSTPCSTPCFTPRENAVKISQIMSICLEWVGIYHVSQVSVFDKAAEMYSGDSCRMARLVGSKNCSQVHARLLKVLPCPCLA